VGVVVLIVLLSESPHFNGEHASFEGEHVSFASGCFELYLFFWNQGFVLVVLSLIASS
jgi:hypothetical protein